MRLGPPSVFSTLQGISRHHICIQVINSIWSLDAKKTDSPLFKSIFYLRNRMLSLCGGVAQLQQLLSRWYSDQCPFTANAYDFFRHKAEPVHWANVVWDIRV